MNVSFIQTSEGMVITALLVSIALYLPLFILYRVYFSAVTPDAASRMQERMFFVVVYVCVGLLSSVSVFYQPSLVSGLLMASFVIWAVIFWHVFTAARTAKT